GHGAQPRRDGEVQLLRPAHQSRALHGRAREPPDQGRRDSDRVPAGLPGAEPDLRRLGRARHAPEDYVSRLAVEPKRGSAGWRRGGEEGRMNDETRTPQPPPSGAILAPGYTFTPLTDTLAS